MRRNVLCSLGLMASVGSSLRADWKITTVTKTPVGQSVQTEYYKGTLRRTDWSDQNGNHKHVQVMDQGNRRLMDWDYDSRQYTEHPFLPPPPASKSLPPSQEITIDRATTDTGERRAFFGRPARHLITRERDSRSGGETLVDGWYIESEGLPSTKREAVLVAHVAGQSQGPPVIKVNQTGPKPSGLAVLLKTTGARGETTTEVTELVQGSLPDNLFQPPSGFDRAGGFSIHWRIAWARFEDWVASLLL